MEAYQCWDFNNQSENHAEAVAAICELEAAQGYAKKFCQNDAYYNGPLCVGVKDRSGEISLWAVEVKRSFSIGAYKLNVK